MVVEISIIYSVGKRLSADLLRCKKHFVSLCEGWTRMAYLCYFICIYHIIGKLYIVFSENVILRPARVKLYIYKGEVFF